VFRFVKNLSTTVLYYIERSTETAHMELENIELK